MLCAVAAVAALAAPSASAAPSSRHAASAASLAQLRQVGIDVPLVVRPVLRRTLTVDEPALADTYQPGVAWEWQWDAARLNDVPDWVLHAAAGVKIGVIDSGADLGAPDVGDKHPATWSVLSHSARVTDRLGHGTFVSSLAAGSVGNGVGISGFGGDAQLLVVQAIDADGYVTDVDEAAAIVYAVRHGAKIVNLSIGGSETSALERKTIRWAAARGVLVVAAAGNEHDDGNQPEYPAALLQPLGSNGRGGLGLAVGATSMDGSRAFFSNTGSYLSLAAPGYNVFAAESADAPWPRAQLPWASPGFYGWASGTSFSSPEVAGAAALVWAANPKLTAQQVAWVLKQSADGSRWNRELGWGRLDAAAAVQLALQTPGKVLRHAHYDPRPIHSSPPS
jgi:subtilisin family serine protease